MIKGDNAMALIGVNDKLFMFAEKDYDLRSNCEVLDITTGEWIKAYKVGSWFNHAAGWREPTEVDKMKAELFTRKDND